MQITVAGLIEILKKKPQDDVVEYVICTEDSQIVAMHIERTIKPLAKMFKSFGRLSA